MRKTETPHLALAGWVHATTDIPAAGLQRERAASADERAAIAKELNLLALDRLVADYRIMSIAGGGWRLAGSVQADATQACVLSLEPLPAKLDETFDTEFWRDAPLDEGGEDKSVLSGPDVEPLAGDEIPVGRIVFETLSAALDPYPRKEGAAFEWEDAAAKDPAKTSPFAVLSRLKDKD